MLSKDRKKKLLSLLSPGSRATGILAEMRVTRDPAYLEACEVVLQALDKRNGVPKGKRGCYYVESDLLSGWFTSYQGYGDRGWIQEVGQLTKHPEPMPITSRLTVHSRAAARA